MQGPSWMSVLVTVLFSISGLYGLVRVIFGRSAGDRLHHAIHLAMSVAMGAMPWAASRILPPAIPLVVFGAATLWYLALALLPHRAAGDSNRPRCPRGLLLYHAGMMAGMVWMTLTMALGHHRMQGMRGMPMTSSGPGTAAVVWGAAFAVAAFWFLTRAVGRMRPARGTERARFEVADAVLDLLMAAGMSLAFLTLMS